MKKYLFSILILNFLNDKLLFEIKMKFLIIFITLLCFYSNANDIYG